MRSQEAKGKASMDDREQERKRLKTTTGGGGGDAAAAEGKSREQDGKSFNEFVQTLKGNVSLEEVKAILAENDVHDLDSAGMYEHCADMMMYGPLERCPNCSAPLKFATHEYVCTGYISEWSKCSYSTKDVPRKRDVVKIPEKLNNEYISKWEKDHDSERRPVREAKEPEKTEPGPFSGMQIVLAGRTRRPQYKLREELEKRGGKVVHVLKEGVSCLVVAENNQSSGVLSKIADARSKGIPVVKETWLQDSLTKGEPLDRAPYEVGGKAKTDEGGEKPAEKRPRKEELPKEQEMEDISTHLTDQLKLTGKRSVHKDSELDREGGKVFEHEGIIYNCAFSLCDLNSGLNNCASMQLVQVPDGTLFLFHKKGKLISGFPLTRRTDQEANVSAALDHFAKLFHELTGNEFEPWERQKKFSKKRSKYYPLDMTDVCDPRAGGLYDDQQGAASLHTKLDPRVARVCKCLLSQSVYRQAMFEMGIHTPELPTGSLSEFHLQRCEECLMEFAAYLRRNERDTRKHEQMCLDLSNKWFSLLPSTHPTVINDMVHLTELGASVLESVRDISIAANIIGDMTGATLDDPLSDRLSKMNCTLTPVDKESDDYKMVQKYLEKTYEPVRYDDVAVDIRMEDLFMVDSSAGPSLEDVSKLKNKVLIWCGTRTCNLVRCLSKGMFSAIYHAPVSGYMFGRGVYCTDTSAKAANYAFTGVDRPEGFLMLAIVGLGENVTELCNISDDVSKYEKEKVAIKGLGKKVPDSSEHFSWKHDVMVPCGSLKPSGVKDAVLDYNEYVVYDPKQVRLQFIVQVRYHEI